MTFARKLAERREQADFTQKECANCGRSFVPRYTTMQVVCSLTCAAKLARKERVAKEKTRRQALETIPELIKVAQREFNAWVRERDRDKGCFVCGKPFLDGGLGGSFDAGHVRSRGAAPHLRFHEDNCHGECKKCNSSWGAKPHEIEAGAIARIGAERYEALKNNNEVHQWEKDELREIIRTYRQKRRDLEALKETEAG